MVKRILVPLDGSHYAESVLPTVKFLAHKLGASVILIHVIEEKAPSEIHEQRHLTGADQATRYLKDIAGTFGSGGITVEQHVHVDGVTDVAQAIAQHVTELSSDLIVLCQHGKSGTKDWAFGSIGQQVVSMDKAPVLIIRPDEKKTSSEYTLDTLLIPLDGRDEHSQGMIYTKELARSLHTAVHLLHVVDTFESVTGEWTSVTRQLPGATRHLLDMEEETAKSYLEAKKLDFEKPGLAVSYSVGRGEPAKQICREAKRIKAGLIILGTHGKKGMDAFWAGSIAAKICRQCSIPLLLVPE